MTAYKATSKVLAGHLAANIENPSDLRNLVATYFPTPQSFQFINQLADRAEHGGAAHSLQGAYGAGKSSLGIFAMHQLASRTKVFSPRRKVGKDPTLAPSVHRVKQMGGMLTVPIVGAPSSLSQRIVQGLRNYAAAYEGRRPKSLLRLLKGDSRAATNDAALLTLRSLQAEVADTHPAGLLLIIDEFGRQFEQMISAGNLDDLHLLQNLAELPGNPGVPFTLVIIQHHGLEHYTNRFMSQQHAEWEKVRGRFLEFVLNNSETDTANIVAAIMKRNKLRAHNGPKRNIGLAARSKLGKMLGKEFLAASQKCQNLHPMTVYLLARISRLLGQGDRTVVGWLSSHLDTGYAAAAQGAGAWIYPAALFHHFFADIQNLPSNPAIAKRFNAVHSAYSRLGSDGDSDLSKLLNTLSMLYFAQGGGLRADFDTIRCCLPASAAVPKLIRTLEEKSLIAYRRHSGEYRVWEGSDYDIQSRLNSAIQQASISSAKVLNERYATRVLAHKHFLETGNHRTAALQWLDKDQPAPGLNETDEPCFIIWLNQCPSGSGFEHPNLAWGVLDSRGVSEYLSEIGALQHMLDTDTALQQDHVALGEVKSQLAFLDAKVENRITSAINADITWNVGTGTHPTLQQAASAMMSKTYCKSVTLHNELINRQRVSGQVTSAARLLIEAMVSSSSKERFGIEKFPAERIIYESLIANKRLHACQHGKWALTLDPEQIASDVAEVVRVISDMGAKSSSRQPRNVKGIIDALYKPPYGLKHMPAALILCIFLYVRKDDIELYEDNRYVPKWSDQTLVRLIKAPAGFGLHIPESHSWPAQLLAAYRKACSGTRKPIGSNTPLNIARDALVRFAAMSSYAKHTGALSKEALGVRRAFHTASSPANMLFSAIPKVFGHKSIPSAAKDQRKFFGKLARALSEMEQADQDLIVMFKSILLGEFACDQLSDARKEAARRANLVLKESRMYHEHEGFLNSIADTSEENDSLWLANLLEKGLGIITPLNEWSDEVAAKAEFSYRARLLGLKHAAGMLDAGFKDKNGKMPFLVWTNGVNKADSVQLSRLSGQLKRLPGESITSLLVELLRQHGGKP